MSPMPYASEKRRALTAIFIVFLFIFSEILIAENDVQISKGIINITTIQSGHNNGNKNPQVTINKSSNLLSLYVLIFIVYSILPKAI